MARVLTARNLRSVLLILSGEARMGGETDRATLLASMDPHLDDEGPYVVATLPSGEPEPAGVVARVEEDEGTTIVAPAAHADGEYPCARITLRVQSSLEAVGFLATVTSALAAAGISANPLSGRRHDHLLVPWERRHDALDVLRALASEEGAFLTSDDRKGPLLTTLRAQFDLTWRLAEYHLERLAPGDLLAEPAPRCATVRRGDDGVWRPDWAEDGDAEPDPVPVPTAAWVTWHLGWWWSGAIAALAGRTPPAREEVTWPGDDVGAVVTWLRGLRDAWVTVLDKAGVDTAAEAPFPWPPGSGRTVADTLAWANAELMKNVAELGQLRLLRAARE